MNKNLLGQVFVLLINILGLLFFIFSLISSYEKVTENNMPTFEITGWLLISAIDCPNHSLSFN